MGADNSKFANERPEIIKFWVPPLNSAFEFPARGPSELVKKINEVIGENDPGSANSDTVIAYPKQDQWVLLDINTRGLIHRSHAAERVVVNGEYIILNKNTLQHPRFSQDDLIKKSKSIFRAPGDIPDVENISIETPSTSRAQSEFGDFNGSQSGTRHSVHIMIRVYRDSSSSQPLKTIRAPASWSINTLCHHLNVGPTDFIVERRNTGKTYTSDCMDTLEFFGWGANGVPMEIFVSSDIM